MHKKSEYHQQNLYRQKKHQWDENNQKKIV